MKKSTYLFASVCLFAALNANATGLVTCDSGPKEQWQSKEKLQAVLEENGWTVRRVKEDGGCWEVYALDENGERVEAYFHPETLERVPVEEKASD
jgi:hypothetical protein